MYVNKGVSVVKNPACVVLCRVVQVYSLPYSKVLQMSKSNSKAQVHTAEQVAAQAEAMVQVQVQVQVPLTVLTFVKLYAG